jgi:hypothetical protein
MQKIVNGALADWTITNSGNDRTQSVETTGADLLPPPAINFTGSCTTLPTAHTVYMQSGSSSDAGVKPVIDTPGIGCTVLKATVQSLYANPVDIYPMLWARSNQNPDFVRTPLTDRVEISASTSGYMVAGGSTPEFAAGDRVESGRWWQEYIGSNIYLNGRMGKSRRFGSYFDIGFTGVTYSAMHHLTNFESPDSYYGNAATGWGAGLHGEGRMPPPNGYQVTGAVQNSFVTTVPHQRAGSFQTASVLTALCDTSVPCTVPYKLLSAPTVGGEFYLLLDPIDHTYRLQDNSAQGSADGGTLIVPKLKIANVPGKGHNLCIADDGTLSRSTTVCP